MPRLPRVTARAVLRALVRAGWYEDRRRGSHLILKHLDKPSARVTLPMYPMEIVLPKTLLSMLVK